MELYHHNLKALFEQLGLDTSDSAIENFIERHKPLAHDTVLSEAAFWNSSQADFIRQALADDADWIIAVDQLDALLR